MFTYILTNRLTNTLDENQPLEQAGLRGGFLTIDHPHFKPTNRKSTRIQKNLFALLS